MRYKKTESSVIRQKGKYQGGDYKKTKHAEFSKKTNISYPLIRTCTKLPYYGRNGVHEIKKISCLWHLKQF